MNYKKLTDYASNKVNPFLDIAAHHIQIGERSVIISTKNPDLIVDTDGNVKGHAVLMRKTKVDKAQFTKIFIGGISAFYNLSKSAIKMFGYITTVIKPNADSFFFDLDECKAFTGYSAKNTIFNALAELTGTEIIARGKNPYHYYINPTIFFNGNRLILLEDFQVDDKLGLENDETVIQNFEARKGID